MIILKEELDSIVVFLKLSNSKIYIYEGIIGDDFVYKFVNNSKVIAIIISMYSDEYSIYINNLRSTRAKEVIYRNEKKEEVLSKLQQWCINE